MNGTNESLKTGARRAAENWRKQAELDGRKVWVIIGGRRCGPCFQMARWIDRQHELLEKDYVIVKLRPESSRMWMKSAMKLAVLSTAFLGTSSRNRAETF